MLIGEYRNKLDAKNRTALPSKFREELGRAIVVTRGYEGCLIIVSKDNWENLVSDSVRGPFISGPVRDTSRFLLAGAFEVDLDGQGRFVVPTPLLDYAKVRDEACFLGLGRWVEVWNVSKWEERLRYLSEKGSEIANRLSRIEVNE